MIGLIQEQISSQHYFSTFIKEAFTFCSIRLLAACALHQSVGSVLSELGPTTSQVLNVYPRCLHMPLSVLPDFFYKRTYIKSDYFITQVDKF